MTREDASRLLQLIQDHGRLCVQHGYCSEEPSNNALVLAREKMKEIQEIVHRNTEIKETK